MKRRQGFTLVEMLVAMALTLFLMAIISECFVTSLETFSQLKALGDMEAKLRTAVNTIRYDLQQDHFEGKRRLSDSALDTQTTASVQNRITISTPTVPIREGFFSIRQVWPSFQEGTDPDGLSAYRTPSGVIVGGVAVAQPGGTYPDNHILHFTVRLRGNQPEKFWSAPVPPNNPPFSTSPLLTTATDFITPPTISFATPPAAGSWPMTFAPDSSFQSGNTYRSPLAEVAYFLVPTGSTLSPNDPGTASTPGATPLYALYRSQFVIVPRTDLIAPSFLGQAPQLTTNFNYLNMACNPDLNNTNLLFYSPTDMAQQPTPLQQVILAPLSGAPVTTVPSCGLVYPSTNAFNQNQPSSYWLSFNRAFDQWYNPPNAGIPSGNNLAYLPSRGYTPVVQQSPSTMGATLVLSNVVSFNVQIISSSSLVPSFGNAFGDIPLLTASAGASAYLPSNTNKSAGIFPRPIYDTTGSMTFPYVSGGSTIPVPMVETFSVNALQISIRIWDQKTQGSRQITFVQDM